MSLVKVGSVATLKSGGPSMTVSETEEGKQEVKCVWFDHTGCIREYWFHPDAFITRDESKENDGPDACR